MLIIAFLIKREDPGPAIFKQKRVGKKKNGQNTYFQLYKFRSMRLDTPHDTPTHMLENPEQYILKCGKKLRKYSLEGNDIIGQTTKSLENQGFREVSPLHFSQGRDLFSNIQKYLHSEGGGLLLA